VAITWAWFLEQMNTPKLWLSGQAGMLWEQADYPGTLRITSARSEDGMSRKEPIQ